MKLKGNPILRCNISHVMGPHFHRICGLGDAPDEEKMITINVSSLILSEIWVSLYIIIKIITYASAMGLKF